MLAKYCANDSPFQMFVLDSSYEIKHDFLLHMHARN